MSFERLSALAHSGNFTLPDEFVQLEADRVAKVKATSELRRSLPEYDGSAQAMLNADMIRAADNTADRADDRVRNYLKSNHSEIIRDHLRPAFDALIAETRKTCPDTTPTTADAAVRVPNGARDYVKLEVLAERYKAILAAAAIIYGGAGRDTHNMFADTKAGPDKTSRQFNYAEPRGPKEPLARLLWLAHAPDAGPHLPTNAERDALLHGFQSRSVSAAHNAAVNNTGAY
jgi:hypothetical protein